MNSERVVGDSVGGVLVGPDIDADQARGPSRESRLSPIVAFVVEAEAVDHRSVFAQAEEPRTGVPGLGTRRQRADLDETEAKRKHRPGNLGVLVEPGGETERIGKGKPEGRDREAGIGSVA